MLRIAVLNLLTLFPFIISRLAINYTLTYHNLLIYDLSCSLCEGSQEGLYYSEESSRAHEDRAVRTGVRTSPLYSGAHHGFSGKNRDRDRELSSF